MTTCPNGHDERRFPGARALKGGDDGEKRDKSERLEVKEEEEGKGAGKGRLKMLRKELGGRKETRRLSYATFRPGGGPIHSRPGLLGGCESLMCCASTTLQ